MKITAVIEDGESSVGYDMAVILRCVEVATGHDGPDFR